MKRKKKVKRKVKHDPSVLVIPAGVTIRDMDIDTDKIKTVSVRGGTILKMTQSGNLNVALERMEIVSGTIGGLPC